MMIIKACITLVMSVALVVALVRGPLKRYLPPCAGLAYFCVNERG